MEIEFGNAGQLKTNDTGWFIGYSDWAKANVAGVTDLRFMAKNSLAHTIHAKWMEHPKDDDRGTAKPPSDGRSISILVSQTGKFRIEFSTDKNFPDGQVVTHTLQKHGDFVIWGENIHHRWFVDDKCVILTFRWIPTQPCNPFLQSSDRPEPIAGGTTVNEVAPPPQLTEYHRLEWESLHREVDDYVKETRRIEEYVLAVTGIVWTWLATFASPLPTRLYYWIPFLFAVCGAARVFALYQGIKRLGAYLLSLDIKFATPDLGWERHISNTKNDRPSIRNSYYVIWSIILLATFFAPLWAPKASKSTPTFKAGIQWSTER